MQWDDLRVFLAVAGLGLLPCFVGAVEPTLGRRPSATGARNGAH